VVSGRSHQAESALAAQSCPGGLDRGSGRLLCVFVYVRKARRVEVEISDHFFDSLDEFSSVCPEYFFIRSGAGHPPLPIWMLILQ
jgi:hypothetical protein